ncbi:hypothetical protein [Reinekea blandensis]|uniref:Nucleotide modification associated domain-containing protein n=1 Tax=Reinekea blandensis MED297 TaxID=314283 RepID=A4BBS8_9GAMM|nr:hypothetical protein [Reinekea blandensis]EAR10413.1 hypothetical protein MED297_01290 [Reinekea sp. MED297] [Reinekea blandensis MED297]
MRLILSRKGFDSSAGGCPSPILPDGRLLSLPIPDTQSDICYRDVQLQGQSIAKWVNNLTGKPRFAQQGAHLDPDLREDALPNRHQEWHGILGQHGAAQSHLMNESVDCGDLFLFFGLFRPIEMVKRRWRFVPGVPARHVIWGWLQIDSIVSVDSLAPNALPWTRYHPHHRYPPDPTNTLYLARQSLTLNGQPTPHRGFGIFNDLSSGRTLSHPEHRTPSDWILPLCFAPRPDEPALSYHRNPSRWQIGKTGCSLRAAARGQEFVLGKQATKKSLPWIERLFN